jgi:iron complex outermembrane receptor protein
MRGDWPSVTVQGKLAVNHHNASWLDSSQWPQNVTVKEPSESTAEFGLVRWTHAMDKRGTLEIQSFVDGIDREEPVGEYNRTTADVDLTYHGNTGRHDVVAGGGYRSIAERFSGQRGYTFAPDGQREHLFSAFAQDDIALVGRRLTATLGAKLERGVEAGFTVQPTARAMWTIVPDRQHVWVAWSRAIRTASLLDRAVDVTLPYQIPGVDIPAFNMVHGNPNVRNETLLDTEAGYRIELRSALSLDLTAFAGRYNDLRTTETIGSNFVQTPYPHIENQLQFANKLTAATTGFELTARWQPTPYARIDGSVSRLHVTPDATGSLDTGAYTFDGNAPSWQSLLHGSVNLARGGRLDITAWHVGPIVSQDIPGYERADARIEWPLAPGQSVAVVGQNVFTPLHLEYSGRSEQAVTAATARSFIVEWRLALKR